MKEDLLMELDELGPLLPSNSLDELIEGLGGPKKVSEVSFSFMIMLVVSVKIFSVIIFHTKLCSLLLCLDVETEKFFAICFMRYSRALQGNATLPVLKTDLNTGLFVLPLFVKLIVHVLVYCILMVYCVNR